MGKKRFDRTLLTRQEARGIIDSHKKYDLSWDEISVLLNSKGLRLATGTLFTPEEVEKIANARGYNFTDLQLKKEMDKRYPDK